MIQVKQIIKRILHRTGFDVRRITSEQRANSTLPIPDILYRFHNEKSFRNILDVGANEGQTAMLFARWFPGAIIHSIEPFSQSYQVLSEVKTAYHNICAYNLALGDESTEKEMFVNVSSATNSLLPISAEIGQVLGSACCENLCMETVPVRTLAEFCASRGIKSIDLLKIDAQGYEERILRGAGDWLRPEKIRLVFLEVLFFEHYEGQAQFEEIYGMMRQKCYKLYGFYDTVENSEQGYLWSNALFIPALRPLFKNAKKCY